MSRIGPLELLIIIGIALIVLGPSKLPELGKAIGKGLSEFRRATRDMVDDFRDVKETVAEPIRETARAVEGERLPADGGDRRPEAGVREGGVGGGGDATPSSRP